MTFLAKPAPVIIFFISWISGISLVLSGQFLLQGERSQSNYLSMTAERVKPASTGKIYVNYPVIELPE